MQLQFEKREISCLRQALRSVKDQELTQELRLTENMPDVGRVLAGWGQAILRGKEWQGGQIAVSGGVQATILYAPEDGSAPRTAQVWMPFAMKWDGADTRKEGPMGIQLLLRFVDGRNLSARKILVRAGVSCLVEAMTTEQIEIYRAPEAPEDVHLLSRAYPTRLPREAGEKTFTLEEILQTGSEPVATILACAFRPELSDAKVTTDKAALRGVGKLHLVYADPDGRLCARDFEIPFSQLAELENAYENDAQAQVMLAVTSLELDMEEENLSLKCGLVAQYVISNRIMVEIVEDAYSTSREVGLRQEELRLPAILDETRERITAKGKIVDTDLDVIDVQFWPGSPQIRREGDRADLTIPGRFQILARDQEGNLRSAATAWEGETAMAVDAASRIDPLILPTGEPQWMTSGGGMEVRADALLQTTAMAGTGLPMISSLELGAIREPDKDRPTLILCRGGKRSFWELARAAGSSVDAIRAANGMDAEPEDDRMLLIPIP